MLISRYEKVLKQLTSTDLKGCSLFLPRYFGQATYYSSDTICPSTIRNVSLKSPNNVHTLRPWVLKKSSHKSCVVCTLRFSFLIFNHDLMPFILFIHNEISKSFRGTYI